MNVRDILERGARSFTHQPAVVTDQGVYTFGECWTRGLRLANGLMSLGVKPADHVAVLEKNSIRSVDFYIAAAIAGIVRVPLYWRNSAPVHMSMLSNAECSAIVVDADAGADFLAGIGECGTLDRVIVRDSEYESWLARQNDTSPRVSLTDDSLCLIRHSGGTTGRPKGIMSTHRQWACIGRDVCSFKPRIVERDTMLHVAPLSHASGYYFLPAWAEGARQVLLSAADPTEILHTLVSERVDHFFLPPTLLDMLVSAGERELQRDSFALKCLAIGSAPISRRTLTEARELFGDEVLYQTYGTSEAVPISGMGPETWFADREGADPIASAGRPLPFVDFDLRNDEGLSVPVGEIGEVTVRCDGMTDGYYRAPEQTAAQFVNGWFRTGDLGRLDEHGYLYLVDRIGETIVSGGHNIYPGDLERTVNDYPGVIEAAAFGVPHGKWGETPVIVCRRHDGTHISAEAIQQHVASELGSYMKPNHVEFTYAALPRTAVGKVARRVVRDEYLGRSPNGDGSSGLDVNRG